MERTHEHIFLKYGLHTTPCKLYACLICHIFVFYVYFTVKWICDLNMSNLVCFRVDPGTNKRIYDWNGSLFSTSPTTDGGSGGMSFPIERDLPNTLQQPKISLDKASSFSPQETTSWRQRKGPAQLSWGQRQHLNLCHLQKIILCAY